MPSGRSEVFSQFGIECGVRLAHFEAAPKAPQSPPLVLVNGWTGDHGIFTPQIAHFGQTRRVVAVDLRGHGASDAPDQEYTIRGFADDIAWQCAQLGLQKPVVIGHRFGGAVVLELCWRYPELASGMVMIDSIVMAPAGLRDSPDLQRLLDGIGGQNHRGGSEAKACEKRCASTAARHSRTINQATTPPPCRAETQ